MSRLGYRPALDGLRGVAILVVVGFHAFDCPRGGNSGVSLFFVLSGFLITTLLLEEQRDRGCISLSGFYARRARRLLPALAVMLVGFVAIAAAKGQLAYGLRSAGEGGLYTENLLQAFSARYNDPLTPLWSLAQEEQFYLVAPLLLIVALRRVGVAVFEWLVWAAIVAVVVETFLLVIAGASWMRLYFAPDTRSLELLVGVGAALAFWRTPADRIERSLAPVGLIGFVAAVFYFVGPGSYVAAMIPVAITALLLVLGVVAHPETATARLLAARPLVFVGRISYSLYLWNQVMLWALDFRHPELAVACSFVAAWLSYRFVEQPFRRSRTRQRLAPAAAVTV